MQTHRLGTTGWQQQMQALRRRYAEHLPGRVAELQDTWHQARTANWDLVRLHTVYRLLHSLKGSGATYGFDGISAAARPLEQLLQTIVDRGQAPLAAQQNQVERGLDGLSRLVAELAAGRTPSDDA